MENNVTNILKKELTIQSSSDNIYQVERLIDEVRDEIGFKDDAYGNVMVAVTEAVNNSILHGNKEDTAKTVHILVEALSHYRIKVEVTDEGPGFDPARLSDPTAPENIENPGGRGVFLMQHLSDELNFHDEGRRVEMFFNV